MCSALLENAMQPRRIIVKHATDGCIAAVCQPATNSVIAMRLDRT